MLLEPPEVYKFRRHGLEKPHNIYQFLTVSIFFSDVVLVSIVYLPLFPTLHCIILSSVYFSLVLCTLVFWAIATKTDPSDPRIYGQKLGFKGNKMNYCTLCKYTVELNSKHCAKCDKCTEDFDHHCDWLNNCVGGRNYRPFFLVTTTMTLSVLAKLLMSIYLLIVGAFSEEGLEISHNFEEKDQNKYLYIIVVGSIKDPFLLIVLGNLLFFHIWLKIKGISTYQYLMNKKNSAKKVNITKKGKDKEKKTGKKEEKTSKHEKNPPEKSKKSSRKTNHPIIDLENPEKENQIEPLQPKQENLNKKLENLVLKEPIPEESELNFTKESVRVEEKMQKNKLDEVKIKKPFTELKDQSHRSAEVGIDDEESLKMSENMRGIKTFDEEFKFKH